jgi:ATP-dependent RNA helicase DHX8/PRP22
LAVTAAVVLHVPQCFRLYTRSYFERQMPDTTPPEICRTSLAGAVLGLKALGLPGLDVLSFDFLDPPEQVRRCIVYTG